MKVVLGFAVLAVAGLLAMGTLRDRVGAVASGGALPGAGVSPRGVPPQLASLIGDLSQAQRVSIGSLLDDAPDAAAVPAPFADRGPAAQVRAVRRAIARALRAGASRTDRSRVAAWQGVFVAGRRAVALADVERVVRSSAHATARHLPLRRVTFGLVRRSGRWLPAR